MALTAKRIAWVATLFAVCATARAQTPRPRPGDVQRVTVISVALGAASTGREAKRVTYTPPPGWYVRGHQVDCKEKTGLSSFTVNTLPRDWSFVTEDQVRESYKAMIDVAAKGMEAGLKAKLAVEQEKALTELRKGRASHHALVVEAVAQGEGFLRKPGSVQLTVTAELVYVGTREHLEKRAAGAEER